MHMVFLQDLLVLLSFKADKHLHMHKEKEDDTQYSPFTQTGDYITPSPPYHGETNAHHPSLHHPSLPVSIRDKHEGTMLYI